MLIYYPYGSSEASLLDALHLTHPTVATIGRAQLSVGCQVGKTEPYDFDSTEWSPDGSCLTIVYNCYSLGEEVFFVVT